MMAGIRSLGRLRRCEGGVSALEFALVAPLFFLMLFGIIEFGRLSWIRTSLQHAADEASRYALVSTGASTSQITDYARARVSGVDPNLVAVNVTQESSGGRTFVVINLSFNFTFVAENLLPYGPIPLVGRSRVATS
ncbi:MAG: pilus assembly protein [Alphaproteobacteria bacterium]|nr:pilus assembly protein [Alphaproteobacteria bacterium]